MRKRKKGKIYRVVSIQVGYHENVISLRYMTPGLKKFHKIMKLAMNITADSDRAVNWLHIGLLD